MDLYLLDAIERLLCALRNISNVCAQESHVSGGKGALQKASVWSSPERPMLQLQSKRPRTRSSVTIWNLPDTVLLNVLQDLHIRDLLSFRSVHPYFRDVIDTNGILWKNVSFANSWPTEGTLAQFTKAAEKKNLEAALKLAVAYLYKEGICTEENVDMSHEAASYFCQAEILTPKAFPFFWIFVRPPWSPDGSCCKVRTLQEIKIISEETKNPDLCFGVGLTLKLQRLTTQGASKVEETKFFNLAVAQKSKAAAFFILLDMDRTEMDKAKELERVRILRLIADSVLEARLFLIKHYVQGQYGGISATMARQYVQNWFKMSQPSRIHTTFSNGPTSDISRYILVDWLVEVLGMKEYSTHTLYLAVSMVDRFLQVRSLQRSRVQLLGVAAMVVSSRYLGFDILTIREAAWLTDNSYTYQDVVRMMGELVAALKGNLKVLNIHDFVMVLAPLIGETCQSAFLMEYLAMLCLLQSEMGQYSPAEIAASCLLLARLLLEFSDPWPKFLQEWTGYTQDYLSLCTFHIYNKCLIEGSEVEYRDTKLQAVKTRYGASSRLSISKIKILSTHELCSRLGVTKLVTHDRHTKAVVRFRNTDELIVSPGRGNQQSFEFAPVAAEPFAFIGEGRRDSATPSIVQDEAGSGYDGDQEDASDESIFSKTCFSDDLDLSESFMIDSQDEEDVCDADQHNKKWNSVICSENIKERVEEFSKVICGDKTHGRVPCLSSMCQLGTKVSCRSSLSSPAACISNCWCERSTSCEPAAGSVSAPETQAGSSLYFSPPSGSLSSPSPPSRLACLTTQNVKACIPRGNITKSQRKTKHGLCPKNCDKRQKDKTCDKHNVPRSREPQPLTRSKSLQNFHSSSNSDTLCQERDLRNSPCSNQIPLDGADGCMYKQVMPKKSQNSQCNSYHSLDCKHNVNHSANKSGKAEATFSSPSSSHSCIASFVSPPTVPVRSHQHISENQLVREPQLRDNLILSLQQGDPKNLLAITPKGPSAWAMRQMHDPATPENSLDSFASGCLSGDILGFSTAACNILASQTSSSQSSDAKRARLDHSNKVGGKAVMDTINFNLASRMKQDEEHHQTSEMDSVSSGPELRRKRKASESRV